MNNTGFYDIEEIKSEWDKYKNESPKLYEYMTIFYWTLLNYFESCKEIFGPYYDSTENVKI